jgi:hypothetical protein
MRDFSNSILSPNFGATSSLNRTVHDIWDQDSANNTSACRVFNGESASIANLKGRDPSHPYWILLLHEAKCQEAYQRPIRFAYRLMNKIFAQGRADLDPFIRQHHNWRFGAI